MPIYRVVNFVRTRRVSRSTRRLSRRGARGETQSIWKRRKWSNFGTRGLSAISLAERPGCETETTCSGRARRPGFAPPMFSAMLAWNVHTEKFSVAPARLIASSASAWSVAMSPGNTLVVVGYEPPGGTCARHPAQSIKGLAQRILALRRVFCHQGHVRGDEGPFIIGDVAWIRLASGHKDKTLAGQPKCLTRSSQGRHELPLQGMTYHTPDHCFRCNRPFPAP